MKTGVLVGLTPSEVWNMELWEYNAVVSAHQDKQRAEISNAILTGYYAAYYMNGGKKAKSPNDLIKDMYKDQAPKQSFEQGLKDIERLREMESREKLLSQ